MIYFLTYLKDSIGNNYLGIDIPVDIVDPYLVELKNHLSDEDYNLFTKNQQIRDHGQHHITVINVMDFNRLSKEMGFDKLVNSIEPVFHYEIDDLEMLGVGKAIKEPNTTYFIVCNSDKLDAIRTRFDLPKQDFHITIGFNPKDVFGVRKNELLN
jgi:hypothetical protein